MKQENMNRKFSRRNFVKLATVTFSAAGLGLYGSDMLVAGAAKREGDQGPSTAGPGRSITRAARRQ